MGRGIVIAIVSITLVAFDDEYMSAHIVSH